MAIKLNINGTHFNFNQTRLHKVINAPLSPSCLKMGLWDRIIDYFRGDVKKVALETLHVLMYPTVKQTKDSTLNKFASFVKLRNLATEEFKDDFTVSMVPNINIFGKNFGTTIQLLVAGEVISKFDLMPFEDNFIRSIIADNKIKCSVTENELNIRENLENAASSKITRRFQSHKKIRINQASTGVKNICRLYGTEISSTSQFSVGDIIVVNDALPVTLPGFKQSHGFIFKIDEIYEDKIIVTKLDLNSSTINGEVVHGNLGVFKFREVSNYRLSSKRCLMGVGVGSFFKLNNIDFNVLRASFIHVAESMIEKNRAKRYSRMYDCNNVIFDTLKRAILAKKASAILLKA